MIFLLVFLSLFLSSFPALAGDQDDEEEEDWGL